ncbi:MAG TPA: FAD-binding oxidoreductase [Candidatus Bathyarchaeia archaeon]|nr:FAD-binding oxidoreductase [Candidatus Bathyarchaeia archaeon]
MAAKPRECRARVSAVRTLTPEILEVDLEVVEPADFTFEAGQWISVPFGPKTVRAWTMVSSPTRRGVFALSIDVSPGGIGSQWARGLQPGDAVAFKGPNGGFVFSRADARRAVFVAEEIGVVPVRSILTRLYETGYGRPTALIYWARNPGWLVYDADFRSLARRYPGFSYLPVLREPPPTWRGEKGEPAEAVERLVHSVDRLIVYVCGGGETINRVRDVLVGKGMDRKSVKWEKFW